MQSVVSHFAQLAFPQSFDHTVGQKFIKVSLQSSRLSNSRWLWWTLNFFALPIKPGNENPIFSTGTSTVKAGSPITKLDLPGTCWKCHLLGSTFQTRWTHWTQLLSLFWDKTDSNHLLFNIFEGLKSKITLLRVIPTMTFIHFVTGKSSGILSDIFSGIPSGILSGISSGILSGKSSGIPSGILSSISSGILSGKSAGILSGKHSGTLSGISSGILADILSGILSGIPSGILSGISSNILSGISSGTLCGISFGVDTRGWGPAGNTGRGWSVVEVRQGTLGGEILAVEVRQGTLGVDGRGWGPAGNTGRGWSWLRSGREHWAGMVVVEVRQGTLGVDGRGWGPTENTVDRGSQLDEEDDEEERRRGEEEQATDIKSNNPHLAGGEKHNGNPKAPRKLLPWHRCQYFYPAPAPLRLPRCPTWQLHGSPRSEPTLDVFFIQEKKHVKSIWGRGAEISSMFWQIQRSLQLGYIQLKVQSVLSRFLQLAFPHSLEHTVYRRIKWYGKITEFSRRFQHLLTLKSHNPSQFDCFHHEFIK